MMKVLSIDSKYFVDPLLLDKTIFCHFKIFKQVILVLLGNDYWKKWNQHYSLCENEHVFAHHHCEFQNWIKMSSWMTKRYNLYIIPLLPSLLIFYLFSDSCVCQNFCRSVNIVLMITLAKIDYPIITQRYFLFLYGLAYGSHLHHVRRRYLQNVCRLKLINHILMFFAD